MESIKEKIETVYNSIQTFIHINGGDIKIKNISDDFNIDIELSGLFHTKPFDKTVINRIENLFRVQIPEIKKINFNYDYHEII